MFAVKAPQGCLSKASAVMSPLLTLTAVVLAYILLTNISKGSFSGPYKAIPDRLEYNNAASEPCVGPPTPPQGWKFPGVYVGNKVLPKLNNRWTSQVGQDKTVVDIHGSKRNGYFLDLAANDAASLSNTLTLEQEFGWRGLCVEANMKYFHDLVHRRCDLAVAVVGGSTNADIMFRVSNNNKDCAFDPACGGIVGDNFDNKPTDDSEVTDVEYKTVTVEKLLDDFNAPLVIDYMSLDIEGAELFAFKHFPFHKYTFLVITVERPGDELGHILEQNGYTYVANHGPAGDEMWIHHSLPNYHEVMEKYAGKHLPLN